MARKNARQLCYDALIRVLGQGGYSNLVLDQVLRSSHDSKENSLASALFYGVIERDITLTYLINSYSKKTVSKLDLEIAVLLKMGFYQLYYMERIPDNAAVCETVALCSYARKTSAKGFVNALLRAFIRDAKKLSVSDLKRIEQMSILYSCPVWLCQKWQREYSPEIAEQLIACSVGRPPLTVRVNTLRTSKEALAHSLQAQGISVTVSDWLENCLSLEGTGSLEQIPEFQNGDFYVQDSSSQCCAAVLDAKPGMTVFDLCSAPGSKAFTVAQQMQNTGKLYAFDLYDHKIELIQKSARKLGICNIVSEISDACVFRDDLPKADRVLCDVPCAGLGIIRRKPEIKYKNPKELDRLPELQYRILQNASRYVKPGGKLLYSTCSLNREENEKVCDRFLDGQTVFVPADLPEWLGKKAVVAGNQATFFPHLSGGDGFFLALFERGK